MFFPSEIKGKNITCQMLVDEMYEALVLNFISAKSYYNCMIRILIVIVILLNRLIIKLSLYLLLIKQLKFIAIF